MTIVEDREVFSAAKRSHEQELRPAQNMLRHVSLQVEPVVPVRKMAFWIERTSFSMHLSSFPLRIRINQVSL